MGRAFTFEHTADLGLRIAASDLADLFRTAGEGLFDVIVANREAIRAVERAARWLLRPGGLVAIEHGAPQGAAVYWVFAEERGWADTRNHRDLAGRDRFVTARRPGGM